MNCTLKQRPDGGHRLGITEGDPTPAGATSTADGWNFTLYSRHATEVTLLLYGATDFVKPVIALELDPIRNKTGRIWHCFLPWMEDARYYAYQVGGPTGAFHRFDAQRVLLDPFAEQVFFPPEFSRAASMKPGANAGRAPLGALPVQQAAAEKFTRPRHQCHDTVKARETSGVTKENRGKFLGLVVARKEPGHEQAPAARATVEPSTRRPGSISE